MKHRRFLCPVRSFLASRRVLFPLLLLAVVVVGVLSACSDEEYHPAVGVTAGEVTPQGSFISYRLVASGVEMDNRADSVDFDVTDEQLRHARLRVTPTIFGRAYYEGEEIGSEGVEVDATQPVSVIVEANGRRATYTVRVVRAKQPGAHDALRRITSELSFSKGLLDYDVVLFNDRFYAMVTSLDEEADVEHYRLYVSDDALNWEEVEYKTPFNLVMGGEGCRLGVQSGRLVVIGGYRSRAKDRNGIPAETGTGMYEGRPAVGAYRAYASEDGVNFTSLVTSTAVYKSFGMEFPITTSAVNALAGITQVFGTVATLGDKLFLRGGYNFAFGIAQSVTTGVVVTEDGENWESLTPVDVGGTQINLFPRLGAAFFTFRDRLWIIGGFTLLQDGYMSRAIYSSDDGITWVNEGELPDDIPSTYHWTGMASDHVAYLMGGETLANESEEDDAVTRKLSPLVLRSTDGVNWERVDVPTSYTGSRMPRLVVKGDDLYYFGTYKTISTGNYAFPTADDQIVSEVWTKFMK